MRRMTHMLAALAVPALLSACVSARVDTATGINGAIGYIVNPAAGVDKDWGSATATSLNLNARPGMRIEMSWISLPQISELTTQQIFPSHYSYVVPELGDKPLRIDREDAFFFTSILAMAEQARSNNAPPYALQRKYQSELDRLAALGGDFFATYSDKITHGFLSTLHLEYQPTLAGLPKFAATHEIAERYLCFAAKEEAQGNPDGAGRTLVAEIPFEGADANGTTVAKQPLRILSSDWYFRGDIGTIKPINASEWMRTEANKSEAAKKADEAVTKADDAYNKANEAANKASTPSEKAAAALNLANAVANRANAAANHANAGAANQSIRARVAIDAEIAIRVNDENALRYVQPCLSAGELGRRLGSRVLAIWRDSGALRDTSFITMKAQGHSPTELRSKQDNYYSFVFTSDASIAPGSKPIRFDKSIKPDDVLLAHGDVVVLDDRDRVFPRFNRF